MSIEIQKRTSKDFPAIVARAQIESLNSAIRYMENRRKDAQESGALLLAIGKLIPLAIGGYWDLGSHLSLNVGTAKAAARMLKRLRVAGYIFGDASYCYSHRDDNGKDIVDVTRQCERVENPPDVSAWDDDDRKPCEYAVRKLYIKWQAEYKPGKQTKCKIVETVTPSSSYRSLVCDSSSESETQ